MAREKRTKPCGNCKKSKVKCEYTDSLPCVRCINGGLASSCSFVVKLPSLSLSSFDHVQPQYPPAASHAPIGPIYEPGPRPKQLLPLHSGSPKILQPPQGQEALASTVPSRQSPVDHEWKSTMESKLSSVDSKFNYILNALTANQQALMEEREAHRKVLSQNEALQKDIDNIKSSAFEETESARKRIKLQRYGPDDFRDNVISLEQAKDMFQFFDAHISQQLFGFEIKSFSVDSLWESSPILICAICTIASMHYPEKSISDKQAELQSHLHKLCTGILIQNRPKTEREGFNTIVALVLCSFWLSDSSMFTGLALQLAKDFQLNQMRPRKRKSSLSDKDRLKLWYLLFILDGQQSMTSNRESLLAPSNDYTLQNSRQLLLTENEERESETASPKTPHHPSYTDLRLVSQVEYNVALSESLKGNAWDLLAPSAFGIPSKSNLELDKWMVSWTVLLAPMNNGAVWSSKSTLIYYNFAKMHINSNLIRQLQATSESHGALPNWQEFKVTEMEDFENSEVSSSAQSSANGPAQIEGPAEAAKADSEYDSDDSDDEEDLSVSPHNQMLANYTTAVNAAQTVINLVLSDTDISNNLRYVPVHIHIMLYYAAILVVSPRPDFAAKASEASNYFHDVAGKLRLVRSLRQKITTNLPTDRNFATQLLHSLDSLFDERIGKLKQELDSSPLGVSAKAELLNDLSTLQYASSQIEQIPENSSNENSPKPERIFAWPGSHHGHP